MYKQGRQGLAKTTKKRIVLFPSVLHFPTKRLTSAKVHCNCIYCFYKKEHLGECNFHSPTSVNPLLYHTLYMHCCYSNVSQFFYLITKLYNSTFISILHTCSPIRAFRELITTPTADSPTARGVRNMQSSHPDKAIPPMDHRQHASS